MTASGGRARIECSALTARRRRIIASGCDDDRMSGEIHVLVPTDDGYTCGLGTPTVPIAAGGVLSGMGKLIVLFNTRIEDLLGIEGSARIGTGVDEVQRFDIAGNPNWGRFTLTFDGAPTNQIDPHPTTAVVERELEALDTVGRGNVVVSKDGSWGYVCSFQGGLGNKDLPQMEADDSQLIGGTIEVSTVTEGASPGAGDDDDAGGVTATSALDSMGQLLVTIADASGQSWTYEVVPTVSNQTRIGFMGRLVSGVPQ